MKGHDDPDGVARPAGSLEEGAASSWGPMAPDGGPMPEAVNLLEPTPGPPHTAEHCPCERNCRYYMHVASHFDCGNMAGGLPSSYAPREHHRCCMVQPGVYLELNGDSPVLECNQWDPLDEYLSLQPLKTKRESYYLEHPNHRPTDQPDLNDDLDLDDDEEEEEKEEEDDEREDDRNGNRRSDKPAG